MAGRLMTLLGRGPFLARTYSGRDLFHGSLRRYCSDNTSSSSTMIVGKLAPDFKCLAFMPSGSFKEVQLSDYKGKYLVLFFYPLDFSFVCPTEIVAFSDRVEEFRKLGCEVIAGSCDSHFSHKAWSEVPRNKGGIGKLDIPLLADINKSLCHSYNVLAKDLGFSLRGLFIIDQKGTVRHMTVNDTGIGRCVDETLRLVQAIKHVDEHGEVCPANWKPGSKTINPNKKDDYFGGVH